jgi:hypothetical protein
MRTRPAETLASRAQMRNVQQQRAISLAVFDQKAYRFRHNAVVRPASPTIEFKLRHHPACRREKCRQDAGGPRKMLLRHRSCSTVCVFGRTRQLAVATHRRSVFLPGTASVPPAWSPRRTKLGCVRMNSPLRAPAFRLAVRGAGARKPCAAGLSAIPLGREIFLPLHFPLMAGEKPMRTEGRRSLKVSSPARLSWSSVPRPPA